MRTLVGGLEHTADFFQQRLQNILFVKYYLLDVEGEKVTERGDGFIFSEQQKSRGGWGNALRFNIDDSSYVKASYENATRLPSARELLGNGSLLPNLDLKPETSHNYNLGYTLENLLTNFGSVRAGVNLFVRDIKDLIQWTPGGDRAGRNPAGKYENISDVRSEGIQGGMGWTSPESFISADINSTWMDYVNALTDKRIANEPYFYINTSLRLNWYDVLTDSDGLSASLHSRFIDEFSLIPEGDGSFNPGEANEKVSSQLSHALGVNYSMDISDYTINVSAEIQNLTDEKIYDFRGVQRPGRSYNAKFIVEF